MKSFHPPQVWRFFTCFLFYGYLGFGFLFNMIFLYPPHLSMCVTYRMNFDLGSMYVGSLQNGGFPIVVQDIDSAVN